MGDEPYHITVTLGRSADDYRMDRLFASLIEASEQLGSSNKLTRQFALTDMRLIGSMIDEIQSKRRI